MIFSINSYNIMLRYVHLQRTLYSVDVGVYDSQDDIIFENDEYNLIIPVADEDEEEYYCRNRFRVFGNPVLWLFRRKPKLYTIEEVNE